MFERTKVKYIEHIRNVQRDLQETRQLIEKDAEIKSNQESAYQQLIEERRQLLTRYKLAMTNVNDFSFIPSSTVSTVDDLRTPTHLISNVTFHRQVFH